MFKKAFFFNQDLCTWGQSISSGVTNFWDMFAQTSCDYRIAITPDLSTTPPGPFCYTCRSAQPSKAPSAESSASAHPSVSASEFPIVSPSADSAEPSDTPFERPNVETSAEPSASPSSKSAEPSDIPYDMPSDIPSEVMPSSQPSVPPSGMPSAETSFTQVAFSTTTELKNQAGKPFDDRDKKYGYAKMMTY
jgi:hypothetical protein